MSVIVHKYGGTSMGSIERIKNVARRVAKWHSAGYKVVVVPSAMSGETNRLLNMAKEITPLPHERELDMLASTGEQASSALLAMALLAEGIPARSYTGWQLPIYTDNSHTKARIISIDHKKILDNLNDGKVVVVTGFQGINENGDITTLGRGGSDTSAVAIAAVLKAKECLIYTDVDGVYTTDPRIVSEARRMSTVSFEEMMEMSSLGSKVLQIRSVEFAGKYRVPTRVLSSLTDPLIPLEEEMISGTLINFEEDKEMESAVVSGIAFSNNESRITLLDVPDTPGIASSILTPVADANIDVDMIVQNQSVDGNTDFSFTINHVDFQRTVNLLKDVVIPAVKARDLAIEEKVAKVSIVGLGMKSHVGVASTMFKTLAKEGVNIKMISTSEIKTSIIIDIKYMELAVRSLHHVFGLDAK
ncbi:Aspartate kinase [Candidatus Kinetoplastibacterium sorsogonicusi]|uniref:Aspartokinase n=1 Tax=Candidatus Kinetoplastidibacterium kentomonadis TaxID=1576550 RepID=A0A3S7J9F6_9PROT|nr:aspartate kinase [Candidatus Kinetoplastibacterium sorsogonicusi]AWD32300.1 Aspartate kinase [Candidatus Kinetoplastibacterium sorsogonicusi]